METKKTIREELAKTLKLLETERRGTANLVGQLQEAMETVEDRGKQLRNFKKNAMRQISEAIKAGDAERLEVVEDATGKFTAMVEDIRSTLADSTAHLGSKLLGVPAMAAQAALQEFCKLLLKRIK